MDAFLSHLDRLCLFLILAGLFPLEGDDRPSPFAGGDKPSPRSGGVPLCGNPAGELESPCFLELSDLTAVVSRFRAFNRSGNAVDIGRDVAFS